LVKTPLLTAAHIGHLGLVRLLLDAGAQRRVGCFFFVWGKRKHIQQGGLKVNFCCKKSGMMKDDD